MDKIDFIIESNRIESISRDPTTAEIDEFDRFMVLTEVNVTDLEQFVSVYEPSAVLRHRPGVDVRVGDHMPPPGGPHIEERLITLLFDIRRGLDVWEAHMCYETLHPFSDCTGRSGRMLWAWQMRSFGLGLGFLHRFYYQTLSNWETK